MRQMLTTTRDMDIDNISLNANDAEDILDKKENELIELGQSLDKKLIAQQNQLESKKIKRTTTVMQGNDVRGFLF